MDYLAWAVILLLIGLALLALEFFIPSGGLLGFLSVCAVLAAITLAYMSGPLKGFLFLGASVVAIPVVLAVAVKVWPETPMGRRLLLRPPSAEEVLPDDEARRGLRALVGQTGRAKSKMLLSGAAIFDGRTVDAVSENMPIEPGQLVRVVAVHGNRVVVRAIEEAPTSERPDDPLSQPLESLGLESFDEPLS
jgi:membrane-bound ClpP family serine protease